MRYREGWQRVCPRHQRWALGAGDGHGLEHLDLADSPAITAARRRWPAVARRATAAGVAPGAAFAVAQAVVCQWWELALEWKEERIWPARLHHGEHLRRGRPGCTGSRAATPGPIWNAGARSGGTRSSSPKW
jgi:hypothetical protein